MSTRILIVLFLIALGISAWLGVKLKHYDEEARKQK